jgi:hypothetical protein
MARLDEPIEPITLGNMRANGVRSLDVSCWQCHYRAIISAAPWPNDIPVPTFGPRTHGVHALRHRRCRCPAAGANSA